MTPPPDGTQLGWTFDPDRPVYQVRQPAPKGVPAAGRYYQAMLWSRTILCWHCTALIPLSPQWTLSAKLGIRVTPLPDGVCNFEVAPKKDMSPASVIKGIAICFHCGGTQSKGYPAAEARAKRMGHLEYCRVIRNRTINYRAGKRPVRGPTWLDFEVPPELHLRAMELRNATLVAAGMPNRYAETDPSLLALGLFGGEESEWAPGITADIALWSDE